MARKGFKEPADAPSLFNPPPQLVDLMGEPIAVPPARLPTTQRAGTPLGNLKLCTEVLGESPRGGLKRHGWINPQLRLYQGGGEARHFIMWSRKAITMSIKVWKQIVDHPCAVKTLEMIDNDKNVCYRVPMLDAVNLGEEYQPKKGGKRYSIPLHLWDKLPPGM